MNRLFKYENKFKLSISINKILNNLFEKKVEIKVESDLIKLKNFLSKTTNNIINFFSRKN